MSVFASFREKPFLEKFAIFFLVLFCIHYIPIEGRLSVGPVKVVTMVVCYFLLFTKVFAISKAFVFGSLYFFYMLFTATFHPESFRWSTILFRAMFIYSFVTFYHLVYVARCFTIDSFLSIVKGLIFAYTICLLLQQVCIIVGLRVFPLFNLCQFLDRGLGGNSLSYEPSSFGRFMAVLYYAYLKCNEYKSGVALTLRDCFKEHKIITYSVLYCIFTMGSGTAFISLALVSLYFLKGWHMLLSLPIFIGVFMIMDYMELEQFKRASSAAEATMTLNRRKVEQADGSAATRIKPMLNTLTIDLSKEESWFGAGIDSAKKLNIYSDKLMIGEINDYGFIAYLLGLLFVFSCAIRFFSIPTIMYFAGVGGGTSNIAYGWGILMVFTCVNYFYREYKGHGY